MDQTTLIYHPDFALHDVGPMHPEQPDRILQVLHTLKTAPISDHIRWEKAGEIDPVLLKSNHTKDHIDWVHSLVALKGVNAVTPDTMACSETPRIARLAAGAAVRAVDLVMAGRTSNVFCAVRPPGHHAESDRAMGFCFINNVALAAQRLRAQHNLERVAIFDWDVHHGNGTQHSFYEDPGVFFVSIHQFPHYPGTGAHSETGRGLGAGYTLNIPVQPGAGDADYLRSWDAIIAPALRAYQPQFILLSAGFDAHARDPLGNIQVSTEGFKQLSHRVRALAEELCEGRLVSILEGGYDIEALCASVKGHVSALSMTSRDAL